MIYSPQSIKTKTLCSILDKNKWSYRPEPRDNRLIKDLIHECVLWLSRRNGHIAWETLEVLITQKTSHLNPEEATKVFFLLKKFYKEYYCDMSNPISRHTIQVELGEDTFEVMVPIITYRFGDQIKKGRVDFVMFDNIRSKHLFMKCISTRIISLWAGLTMRERYRIININLDKDNEIIDFEPTSGYLDNSRKVLKSMVRSLPKQDIYPSEEICVSCPHLYICPL